MEIFGSTVFEIAGKEAGELDSQGVASTLHPPCTVVANVELLKLAKMERNALESTRACLTILRGQKSLIDIFFTKEHAEKLKFNSFRKVRVVAPFHLIEKKNVRKCDI